MRWVALFLLTTISIPRDANACSCLPMTEKQRQAESDAIFEGDAMSVTRNAQMRVTATFVVRRAIKGVKKDANVVIDGGVAGGGMCGAWFEKGKRYTVYAIRNEKGVLSTNKCLMNGGSGF